MPNRTRKEQIIEAVAGIIAAQGWDDFATCEAVNQGDGWGFDVRWDDEEYTSDQSFTRLQDVQLSPDDLERAIFLARIWQANPRAL